MCVYRSDEFMVTISQIVFLYYTAVWAVVSTLVIYVTRYLQFSPIAMGWLLSFYGISTVFSEAILVRYIVPYLGEMQSIRLGLVCFSIQTMLLAFSNSPLTVFIAVSFSMLSNLIYPAVSSLVSKIVEERKQGEAQGALNGIKALTEGFGPLFFGSLMALYEHSILPGAPYLLATILALWSLLHTYELPSETPEVSTEYDIHFQSIDHEVNKNFEMRPLLSANADEEEYDEEDVEKNRSSNSDDVRADSKISRRNKMVSGYEHKFKDKF